MTNEEIRQLFDLATKYKGLIKRSISFPVDIVSYLTGVEQRILYRTCMTRKWEIPLQILTEDERDYLIKLYSNTLGSWRCFPFVDPLDCNYLLSYPCNAQLFCYVSAQSILRLSKNVDRDRHMMFVGYTYEGSTSWIGHAVMFKRSRYVPYQFVSNSSHVVVYNETDDDVYVYLQPAEGVTEWVIGIEDSTLLPMPDWVVVVGSTYTIRPKTLKLHRWIGESWEELDYIFDVRVYQSGLGATTFDVIDNKYIKLKYGAAPGDNLIIECTFGFWVRFEGTINIENLTYNVPGLYSSDNLTLVQVKRMK